MITENPGHGLSRRQYLALMAGAVGAATARPVAVGARAVDGGAKPLRGAFMILNTPFSANGEVDWDDLVNEVRFVDRHGVQGVVWPQGSSGVTTLTKEERLHGMTLLAKTCRTLRVACVLGVQGKDTAEMLEYARHAETLDPDAFIAMPPTTGKSVDQVFPVTYARPAPSPASRPPNSVPDPPRYVE